MDLGDVFGSRHEGDSGVEAVVCEPIDFVDDAIRHLMGGDVVEHPFQVGAVGGSGRFPGVDELRHDPRAEFFGFARVCSTLGRDRDSIVPSARGGMLPGRQSLIRHRSESSGFRRS